MKRFQFHLLTLRRVKTSFPFLMQALKPKFINSETISESANYPRHYCTSFQLTGHFDKGGFIFLSCDSSQVLNCSYLNSTFIIVIAEGIPYKVNLSCFGTINSILHKDQAKYCTCTQMYIIIGNRSKLQSNSLTGL